MKIQFSIWRKAFLFALGLCLAVPALATPLRLVTTMAHPLAPDRGGGKSISPVITTDSRYVLFASTADNMALTSTDAPFASRLAGK